MMRPTLCLASQVGKGVTERSVGCVPGASVGANPPFRRIRAVSLHLYDTARRELREFHPKHAGTASMYVCGATVQGVPHVGHVRSGLDFDVLRRWLAHSGYDVLLVRNVTDIDDKILNKAEAAGRPWWEWA